MIAIPEPQIARYMRWLRRSRGLEFASYEELWSWSTTDVAAFWGSIWAYFEIESPTRFETVLVEPTMPGARWFPGAQVNYARQALRHTGAAHAAGQPAIVWRDESMGCGLAELSWPELRRQVASLAARLEAFGVKRGDRVCAWLPNRPQTVIAFLACASVGALWSLCSPDMGRSPCSTAFVRSNRCC